METFSVLLAVTGRYWPIAIDWFQENHIKVNASKFQLSLSPRVSYLMLNFMDLVILWNQFLVLYSWE